MYMYTYIVPLMNPPLSSAWRLWTNWLVAKGSWLGILIHPVHQDGLVRASLGKGTASIRRNDPSGGRSMVGDVGKIPGSFIFIFNDGEHFLLMYLMIVNDC